MKKIIHFEEIEYYCDACEKDLKETLGVPITVEFGYGHALDCEEYHFCSNDCLLSFLVDEMKKDVKTDERFIYGKEEDNEENGKEYHI